MEIKKKVLVFIPEFPVLSETFIQREIVKLSVRNVVDVVVLSIKKGKGEIDKKIVNKVIYQRLDLKNFIFGLLDLFCKPKLFFDLWKIIDGEDYPKTLKKLSLIFKSFGYAKIIQKEQPDFIFSHFLSYPSSLMMLVSKILGIPYGISAHAKDITVNPELVKQKIDTSEFVLICNKNGYANVLNYVKSDNQKVFLKYHGLDFSELEQIKDKPSQKNDKPVILSVGRLVEKKGHRYLIEASKILKSAGVEHLIIIIGAGDLYSELHNKIISEGLEENIEIIGGTKGVPFSETVKYYNIASVLAYPGIKTPDGDEDGLPNVILEASAFYVPVVSTDAGSILDFVRHNETGLVVPQRDSKRLAEALKNIMNNHELSRRVALNANTKAKQLFDLDNNVKEIENFILGSLK